MKEDHDSRDAGTGRFVSDEAAAADPGGTVRESIPRGTAGQVPSPGRVVHYVSYGTPGGEYLSACRAATVAEAGAWVDVETSPEVVNGRGRRSRMVEQEYADDACALVVQNPTGQFFNTCRHDEGGAPGTWHWPERA